ncbi:hypothetical protein GOV09_04795 [Candidatus Woesearchaeota archaeon]|nr:hypothetical protein [Candidatus Woesearchaeota archaeon]
MKKAAIELSLNFIVTIIISLVILSFGIIFIYNILGSAQELRDLTLDDIDQRIAELSCSSDEKVCIINDRVILEPKKFEIVGVKVLNMEGDGNFLVKLDKGIYITPDNLQKIGPTELLYENNIEVMPWKREEMIRQNDEKTFGFGFELVPGTRSGTYVYDLKVYRQPDPNQYDRTHKIYITVD